MPATPNTASSLTKTAIHPPMKPTSSKPATGATPQFSAQAAALKLATSGDSAPENSKLPHTALGLTKAQVLAAHQSMLMLRRFEEKAAALYQQQEIQGFCHLYIGQEAVAVGAKTASIPGDDFITSYRCHALALVCGLTGEEVMSELTGRVTGISKGKGGSMHMFEPSKHFWGGHGIVAAQVPLGAGLAFARKYQAEVMHDTAQAAARNVCFTFIGDGAMNAGQTFETLNMAALWQLPVIFVIENNQYGMGTSVARAAAGKPLHTRGETFGIPGEVVDGMDVFAVLAACRKAATHCRSGQGPYLLEMDTYRYRGHSMSDPAKYRTRDDVEGVRTQRDPITRIANYLMANLGATEAELEAVDETIKAEVERIATFATTAPRPGVAELWTDIVPE